MAKDIEELGGAVVILGCGAFGCLALIFCALVVAALAGLVLKLFGIL